MNSSFFISTVDHCRCGSIVHRFRYSSLSALIDLDELEHIGKTVTGFSYNRFNIFSIWDKDYLPGTTGNIKQRLMSRLADQGIIKSFSRIELLTCPKYFGYVFNPVSFYMCYLENDTLDTCVAEVNNTFGETHLYILSPETASQDAKFKQFNHWQHQKEFHVSPFYDRSGNYQFYFHRTGDLIDVRVNLTKQGETVFTSGISGRATVASPSSLLKLSIKNPLLPWLTFPRITWQATKLHFLKGLPVFRKPPAIHSSTIKKASASLFEKLSSKILLQIFSKLKNGRFILTLPDNKTLSFGTSENNTTTEITVHDWKFFPKILLGGDIGFGEAYMEGLWTSPDLTQVFHYFVENAESFNERNLITTKFKQLLSYFAHRVKTNSLRGSKKNIRAHYDLGNELFTSFLDKRLLYSCAHFSSENDSLEDAQYNKVKNIIKKANIQASDHVLEIGSGWGAFAIEAAKQTGCRITSITLSEEQLCLANERVAEAGLADRVKIELCDYRKMKGQFDKIVSIEMLEAVGHEHLGMFFETCDRLLKPHGLVALQFISIPDQKYDAYRKSCDWIQRYIFPGGLCPSLTAVSHALTNHSRFVIEHLENIGPSYARTLKEWRERFLEREKDLHKFGYDETFKRMWEYYMCYCEAGFASRTLGTLQLVLTRPNNMTLPSCPGY